MARNTLDLIHDIKGDINHIETMEDLKKDIPFINSWCDQIEEDLKKLDEITNIMTTILMNVGRPIKNTTKQECYSVLYRIQELVHSNNMDFGWLYNQKYNDELFVRYKHLKELKNKASLFDDLRNELKNVNVETKFELKNDDDIGQFQTHYAINLTAIYLTKEANRENLKSILNAYGIDVVNKSEKEVLEILKDKTVNIEEVDNSENYDEYYENYYYDYLPEARKNFLTEEEYNKLKEWLNGR